jgi:hypothetical protein
MPQKERSESGWTDSHLRIFLEIRVREVRKEEENNDE